MTKPQHALSNAIQIIYQRWRDVGSIESRLVRIADDGAIAVVGSKDDETRLADIEDVVTGLSANFCAATKATLRSMGLACNASVLTISKLTNKKYFFILGQLY